MSAVPYHVTGIVPFAVEPVESARIVAEAALLLTSNELPFDTFRDEALRLAQRAVVYLEQQGYSAVDLTRETAADAVQALVLALSPEVFTLPAHASYVVPLLDLTLPNFKTATAHWGWIGVLTRAAIRGAELTVSDGRCAVKNWGHRQDLRCRATEFSYVG